MEHISLAVSSVLARIANSGMIRLNAGEVCCGPVIAISAQEEKGEKMTLKGARMDGERSKNEE